MRDSHTRTRGWVAGALVIALGGIACAGPEDTDVGSSPGEVVEQAASGGGPSVVRGFLVLGPEVRSIKPCDEERELWVVPVAELTAAYEALSYEPYAPVFVEVVGRRGPAPETGFGADYDGLLTVTALHRAAPSQEGAGCAEGLAGFAFRAAGQEPFWHVRITPGGIVYSTPDIPETRFAPAEPFVSAGGWVYESTATGPESISIRVSLEPVRCQDSMVGAIYSWSATVDLEGEVRRGCAWEGGLAPGR